MKARLLVVLLAGVVVFAACDSSGDLGLLFLEDDSGESVDYPFLIPRGAGEAIDRGEPLEILPRELTVEVGEVLELVNEDDRGHLVGPFFVGAGETVRQQFSAPGSFIGACSVHPSGEFILTVVE
jgi:hypothetical protein